MKPWEEKANRIIGQLSRESWLQANRKKDGTMRKRHVPYTIPQQAQDLVNCLGWHDRIAAELRAKQIFMELLVLENIA